VKEAIAALQGNGPADLWAHCLDVAGHMLILAKKADSLEVAREMATAARDDGRALEKFRQLVTAQGGDADLVDHPEKLAQASLVEEVRAEQQGYIAGVNARTVGWSCVQLGAGRQTKEDKIDYAVGMVIPVKVGDRVNAGDLLATIHANDPAKLAQARRDLQQAISWSDEPVAPLPHL
jgi:thymidine phosphorylase